MSSDTTKDQSCVLIKLFVSVLSHHFISVGVSFMTTSLLTNFQVNKVWAIQSVQEHLNLRSLQSPIVVLILFCDAMNCCVLWLCWFWTWQGKYFGLLVCFLLGNGCLFAWNSMLTIEDYYAYLFPVCSSFTITVYMIFIIYAQFQVCTG